MCESPLLLPPMLNAKKNLEGFGDSDIATSQGGVELGVIVRIHS